MSQRDTGHPDEPISAALANTYDVMLAEPEHLRSPADLERFMRDHGVPRSRAPRSADLAPARSLRGRVRAIFEAPSETVAGALVNALLADVAITTALERRDGQWQITRRAAGSDPIRALQAEVAHDLAALLVEGAFPRAKVCQASPCRDAFIDRSRNASRRFCCVRCATRQRVASHRRQKSASRER
jgi:predicted RNA-binding Zn ribbon-like protein